MLLVGSYVTLFTEKLQLSIIFIFILLNLVYDPGKVKFHDMYAKGASMDHMLYFVLIVFIRDLVERLLLILLEYAFFWFL